MAIYLEAWRNDGKPDAESRIATMPVKSKREGQVMAEIFGKHTRGCVRVTLLYTGNMTTRKTLETLWLRPGYVTEL